MPVKSRKQQAFLAIHKLPVLKKLKADGPRKMKGMEDIARLPTLRAHVLRGQKTFK